MSGYDGGTPFRNIAKTKNPEAVVSDSDILLTALADEGGNAVEIDPITRAQVCITYPHHEVHEGDMYLAHDERDLANGASFDYSIITPNSLKLGHMQIEANSGIEMSITVWEAPTLSANGTPLIAYNKNRNSLNVATVIVNTAPTVTTTGALKILYDRWGSGKSEGGGSRGIEEFVLKANTKYLVRFTNKTTSANWVVPHFNWYEHTNKG